MNNLTVINDSFAVALAYFGYNEISDWGHLQTYRAHYRLGWRDDMNEIALADISVIDTSHESWGKDNRLALELGIARCDPVDAFWAMPSLSAFRNVPKGLQTQEMVDVLFQIVGGGQCLLNYLDKKLLTDENCLKACSINGFDLKNVPEKLRSPRLCDVALENAGDALEYVPTRLLSKKRCKLALQNSQDGMAFHNIPRKLLEGEVGREICAMAVEKNPRLLEYVPAKLITKAVALKAIQDTKPEWNSKWPIGFLPKRYLTEELIKLSVSICPKSLSSVPLKGLTEDICLSIVVDDPSLYRYLPEQAREYSSVKHMVSLKAPDMLELEPTDERLKNKRKEDLEPIKRVNELDPLAASRKDVQPYSAEIPPYYFDYREQGELSCSEEKNEALTSDLQENGDYAVNYISDLHVEHHVNLSNMDRWEAQDALNEKVGGLVSSLHGKRGLILFAGDIADSVEVEDAFFSSFVHCFAQRGGCESWTIIRVLGNHEIWDLGGERKEAFYR